MRRGGSLLEEHIYTAAIRPSLMASAAKSLHGVVVSL